MSKAEVIDISDEPTPENETSFNRIPVLLLAIVVGATGASIGLKARRNRKNKVVPLGEVLEDVDTPTTQTIIPVVS